MRPLHRTILPAFLIVTALAVAEPTHAQLTQTSVRFDHLGVEDGLPDKGVNAIYEDPDGYVWIGTSDGLARYDGYEFEVFRYDPDNPNSLYDTTIHELAPSSRGGMWISTFSGIEYFDSSSGSFSRFLDADGSTLPFDQYYEVLEDSEGRVWAGSSLYGVFRLDPEAREIRSYQVDPDDDRSLDHPQVLELFESSDGTLWIATAAYGLHRYRPESDDFERMRLRREGETIYEGYGHIVEDDSGVLWMGGWGITRFDPATGESRVFLPDPSLPEPDPPIWTNYINSLSVALDGRIWAGSNDEGLFRFDPATSSFENFRHESSDASSLAENDVTDMLIDRSGLLWVGTEENGLSRLDPRREHVLRLSAPGKTGLHQIREDDAGRLWLPFREDLVMWSPDSGTSTSWRHGYGRGGFVNSEISALATAPSTPGTVWIGAGDGTVRRMDSPGRISASYQIVDDAVASEGSHPVFYMMETTTEPGVLWLSAWNHPLCRLDIESEETTCFERSDSLGAQLPREMVEDILEPGILWVSSDNGLHRFDTRSGRYTDRWLNDPADTTSISIDFTAEVVPSRHEPGILWVGTWAGGLNRFDTRTGRVTRRYTEQNSDLPHNTIMDVLEEEDGTVWVGTARGIGRIDPVDGVLSDYTNVLGLPRQEIAGFQARNGDFVLSDQENAVYRFDPDSIRSSRAPPAVHLTALRIRDALVEPAQDAILKEPLSRTEALTLDYDQRDVSFDYVALDFLQPEGVRYAYRMEGYEEDWRHAGAGRRATYTNLPPGEYTFRVQAANADGVWNEDGASVRVVIRPPWWRSIWAYGMYGLFLVGGVFAADRFQRRRLVRRERERAREKELEQARRLEEAHRELEATHRELAQSHEHLKATQQQLVEQEKLASLGSLTAGIAHEIKNPLNFVNNFAEVSSELAVELREAVESGDAEAARSIVADLLQNTDQIAKHGKRADSIVRSMMQHARGGSAEKETVDVNDFVGEYIDLAWHGMRARNDGFNADVDRDFDPNAGEMTVQSQEIGRVLVNLLNNAFQVLSSEDGPEKGRVRVATRRDGTNVEIIVSDNGPGIPPEIRPRIFEPFFTTKATGEGTGLGLSLSYDIVTKGHGGEMIVDDAPGGGARFTVRLPAE